MKPLKILFADDDLKYSMLLKRFLEKEGYEVTYAGNGLIALDQFPLVKPDLVLLDINMPGLNGFEVAKRIREADKHVLIFFLSDRSDKADRLPGVTSQLSGVAEDEMYAFGHSVFNYSTNEIRTGNSKVLITSRQADILRLLALNVNKTVSRDTLLDAVWGTASYANSLALNVQMSYLRRKKGICLPFSENIFIFGLLYKQDISKKRELMMSLGGWMNKILIGWGIDPKFADMFDETIIALLMVGLSIGLDYLCQAIFVGGMKHYTRRSPHQWNTLLMKRRVIHHLIHILPGILIYYLLPMAFVRGKEMLEFSQKVCAVYIIVAVLLTINGLLLVLLDVYNMKDKQKNRPLKGFVQVLQVLLFFIGGIIVVSVLIGKSPMTLFAGLGASAAVLMLVFKDSILGFVAGVQLSANDMLRIGDWIALPQEYLSGYDYLEVLHSGNAG